MIEYLWLLAGGLAMFVALSLVDDAVRRRGGPGGRVAAGQHPCPTALLDEIERGQARCDRKDDGV